MYKVGDYAIFNKQMYKICSKKIIREWDGLAVETHRVKNVIDNSIDEITISALRFATLADWVVYVPAIGYIVLVDNGNEAIEIRNEYDKRVLDTLDKWVGEAVSAHYNIPIMPYKQYEEYVKNGRACI